MRKSLLSFCEILGRALVNFLGQYYFFTGILGRLSIVYIMSLDDIDILHRCTYPVTLHFWILLQNLLAFTKDELVLKLYQPVSTFLLMRSQERTHLAVIEVSKKQRRSYNP